MLQEELLQALAEEFAAFRHHCTLTSVTRNYAGLGAFVIGMFVDWVVLLYLRRRHINVPATILEAPGKVLEFLDEAQDGSLSRCNDTLGPGTRDSRCSYCYGTMRIGDRTIEHSTCLNRWHCECIDHWLSNIHIQETACPICRDPMDDSATTVYIYGQGYRPRRMQLLSERCLRSFIVLTLVSALVVTMFVVFDLYPTTVLELVMQTLNNILLIYAHMTIFLQLYNERIQRPSSRARGSDNGSRRQMVSFMVDAMQQQLAGVLLKTILYGSKDCWLDSAAGTWMAFESLMWAGEAMKSTGAVIIQSI